MDDHPLNMILKYRMDIELLAKHSDQNMLETVNHE